MHFNINKEILLNNLIVVSKALASSFTLNRNLSGIKIEAKNNSLTLVANSGDIAIKTTINDPSLQIKEENVVLVPGKSIIEMIKKIEEPKVEIFIFDNQLLIKSNSLEYKLNLFNVEDFPEVEFVDLGTKIIINSSLIKNISKEVGFSASISDKKPIYQGINFKYDNGVLTNMATDSFRLSLKTTPLDLTAKKMDFTIPSKSIDELSRILDYYNDDIEMFVHPNAVLFKFQNTYFRTRLLEGQFPDGTRIVPPSFSFEVTFLKDDLLRAIDKVSITSSKDSNSRMNQVQFKVRLDKVVELTAINDTGSSKQEVTPSSEIDAKAFEMLLNLKYLTDAVRGLPASEIKMCFVDVRRPIVIKSVDSDSIIHVVLPLAG